ncbi:MAG: molybdate ABC transporter substrate-binding protein [Pirellulales bacterium]
MKRSNRLRVIISLALAMGIGCCGGCSNEAAHTPADADAPATPDAPLPASPPLLASVAASAATTFESLGGEFTRESRIDVKVNSGASSGLAGQILQGSPADLFLSANSDWASKVADAGFAVRSVRLLTNDLVLIVPRGNPAGIHAPDDLRKPTVKRVALAGEKVPAGMYADQVLTKLGLLKTLVADGRIARGADVRSTLRYVARGEAEAGIVYSTDVLGESEVETVHAFDPSLHDEIVYVLVQIKSSRRDDAAARLFDFLAAPERTAAYQRRGFRRVSTAGASAP